MIFVNVRAIIERKKKHGLEVLIQTRNRKDEPSWYEFPGGQIKEFESITNALKREIFEETGLTVSSIENEKASIIFDKSNSTFSTQCIKPYSIYQTIKDPIDSFGAYFRCRVDREINDCGDDVINPHWVTLDKLNEIVYTPDKFSEIGKPTALMYLHEFNK